MYHCAPSQRRYSLYQVPVLDELNVFPHTVQVALCLSSFLYCQAGFGPHCIYYKVLLLGTLFQIMWVPFILFQIQAEHIPYMQLLTQ